MTRLPGKKVTVADLPVPLEDDEQIEFIEYLEVRNLKYTAIPNNTWTPSHAAKRRNYNLGLRPGFPDMVVVLPGTGLACVEMKRTKGGTVSEEQQSWIDALNTIPGVEARVCKGCRAAIDFIEELYPSSPAELKILQTMF